MLCPACKSDIRRFCAPCYAGALDFWGGPGSGVVHDLVPGPWPPAYELDYRARPLKNLNRFRLVVFFYVNLVDPDAIRLVAKLSWLFTDDGSQREWLRIVDRATHNDKFRQTYYARSMIRGYDVYCDGTERMLDDGRAQSIYMTKPATIRWVEGDRLFYDTQSAAKHLGVCEGDVFGILRGERLPGKDIHLVVENSQSTEQMPVFASLAPVADVSHGKKRSLCGRWTTESERRAFDGASLVDRQDIAFLRLMTQNTLQRAVCNSKSAQKAPRRKFR